MHAPSEVLNGFTRISTRQRLIVTMKFGIRFLDQRHPGLSGSSRPGKIQALASFAGNSVVLLFVVMIQSFLRVTELLEFRDSGVKQTGKGGLSYNSIPEKQLTYSSIMTVTHAVSRKKMKP